MNNPNFNPADFGGFKSRPGENAFTISPQKWVQLTNAIGIKVKSGRYDGGTYAYRDIALAGVLRSAVADQMSVFIQFGQQCRSNQVGLASFVVNSS